MMMERRRVSTSFLRKQESRGPAAGAVRNADWAPAVAGETGGAGATNQPYHKEPSLGAQYVRLP